MASSSRNNLKPSGFETPKLKMELRRELQEAISRRNNLTSRSKLKCIKFLENSFEADNTENDDFDRRNKLRRQATEEILTSERSYINQLDKLVNYFVNPLKSLNLIDVASHTNLFGQIELIHNINVELMNRLEADLDDVANAFLKLAPFFKIYSVYAFDYKNAMILLQTLTTKNAPFRAFLEKTESRPEIQQKLNSLMITPIQRVPRYRLLLQQVLLYTSPADSDYKIIQESIRQIESSINHINSVVEDQENISRLINIQNSLNGRIPNIMRSVSRKFIKEGTLFKYSASGSMMKRYCILCSDIFMYCKILKVRRSIPNQLAIMTSLSHLSGPKARQRCRKLTRLLLHLSLEEMQNHRNIRGKVQADLLRRRNHSLLRRRSDGQELDQRNQRAN